MLSKSYNLTRHTRPCSVHEDLLSEVLFVRLSTPYDNVTRNEMSDTAGSFGVHTETTELQECGKIDPRWDEHYSEYRKELEKLMTSIFHLSTHIPPLVQP
jgi:hypothetical protein